MTLKLASITDIFDSSSEYLTKPVKFEPSPIKVIAVTFPFTITFDAAFIDVISLYRLRVCVGFMPPEPYIDTVPSVNLLANILPLTLSIFESFMSIETLSPTSKVCIGFALAIPTFDSVIKDVLLFVN